MATLADELAPRPSPARLWTVPVVSTLAGSACTLAPPLGLMMALGWRLLRPEMWPAWVALPLGLADDLLSGAPVGTATALWTLAFLGIDIADHRPMWRDHWLDWWLASLAIAVVGVGSWALAAFAAGGGALWPLLPQLGLAVLVFPVAQRLCARLDRWRLGSGRLRGKRARR